MTNNVGTQNLVSPPDDKTVSTLKSGDRIFIDGIIYTARDQAHQKLVDLIKEGKPLPFDLNGQIIFYAGPVINNNFEISAIGPTTAGRMDNFLEPLLKAGIKATIGKGPRKPEVKEALKKYKAVYLIATGGAAALLAQTIKKAEIVAFPELGPEAIFRLEVSKFPAIVAYDSEGGDIFEEGIKKYAKEVG